MAIGIIFWIVFAILVGAFWSSKKRSFAAGFFLSLLLSPLIGFIIGLVIKPDVKAQEEQAISKGIMRKCPYCAEIIKHEAVVCRYCGKDLPEIKSELASEPAPKPVIQYKRGTKGIGIVLLIIAAGLINFGVFSLIQMDDDKKSQTAEEMIDDHIHKEHREGEEKETKKRNNYIAAIVLGSAFLLFGGIILMKARITIKVCPFCSKKIKITAKVCKHCGKDLNPDEQLKKP